MPLEQIHLITLSDTRVLWYIWASVGLTYSEG